MHESLFLEVIKGHMRSQKVKNWYMLNLRPNHIVIITTTKPISCVYNLILMTNIHAKNNLPGCYGYGVIEEWNFKLKVKNTFWASVTSNDLQWPRGTNFHELCNYLWKNEYTCKKSGLCVMFLIFTPGDLLVTYCDLLWPFRKRKC